MTKSTLNNFDQLLRLIAASKFPKETGSTRLRQLAFLNMVDLHHRLGEKPTARGLSKVLNAPPSQMDLLAVSLEEKGVIERVLTPNLTKGKRGKVLYIRDDAVQQLNDNHIRFTGISLLDVENS
ncbi:hypothetical protein G6L32_14330 [Agrobacterium tumefaciens]|uniref:hypothetical protein n=1 Tax=Agrobacterium tumefaciens TaxID=358 RepID=UPI00157198F2|nr:hypothetical protein [Agrobacterium tumefaciens]